MGNPKGIKRDFEQLEQRRLTAARLFDRGLSQSEVSRELGVHRQSVNRWFAAWEGGGIKALKQAGRAGRKPRLAPRQLGQVESALKQGPQAHGFATALWTTARVAQVIGQLTGVRYHPDHVCRILAKLRWSCQRPVGRALERDEKKIEHWKKQRWPAIKKKPLAKAAPSSSLMKAA